MKALTSMVIGAACVVASSASFAWKQPTHKLEVIAALNYMGSSLATPEQKRAYNFYVKAANGDAAKAGDALGQACYDADDFVDVRLGGWRRGYEHAPLWGMAASIVNYTSYYHFTTMSRGKDAHGNANGGYNYRHRTPNGSLGKGETFDIDYWAAIYLWNTQLKRADYDNTEAKYRQGSYSNYGMYKDFQNIPWQPSANASRYWFKEFLSRPTFQMMGYSLHFLTDGGQVHHTMSTSANHHASWEAYVEDNYAAQNFANIDAIHARVSKYNPRQGVREILSQLAGEAYTRPEPLYATDSQTRSGVARDMIPETIAAAVAVLTKGVNCLESSAACGAL